MPHSQAETMYGETAGLEAAPVQAGKLRQKFAGFVSDPADAALLRLALGTNFTAECELHVAKFRTALKVLSRIETPEILLIDLTGEDQPINAMMDLAELVEPGTKVLLIGEARELSFYRSVVEGMGVQEYLARPLTREAVTRFFMPYFNNVENTEDSKRGGRLIAIAGVRGGVGTSTIAANLAWMIGNETHRHTLLLDADLQTGSSALSLNMPGGKGLLTALESPDRLDTMLLERAVQRIGERLHLLSAQEELTRPIHYVAGSATVLTKAVRRRYNYVIADAGAKLLPFSRDLLFLAHQRVLILDPTTIAMRNCERLLSLPGSSAQTSQPMLVLNHAGRPNGLTQKAMEQSLGARFSAVIPELPRVVPKADQFGEIAAASRGAFREAILALTKALGITAIHSEKIKIRVTS